MTPTSIEEYRGRNLTEWDTKPNLDLIQRTVAPGLTPDEFSLFIETARFRGLNPLTKQIYAIIHNADNARRRLTIITGIDGFRTIANRTGKFAGMDRPVFEAKADSTTLDVCVLTGYKMVEGQRCAFSVEAYWDEYAVYQEEYEGYGTNRKKTGRKVPSEMWGKMPRTMLAKVAEAKLLRMMLPEELSGLYTSDEMEQARVSTTTVAPPVAELGAEWTETIEVEDGPRSTETTHGNDKPVVTEADTQMAYAREKPGTAPSAAIRWFHATNRDKHGVEYEEVCAVLGVKSIKDLPDKTLGQIQDLLALAIDARDAV